MLAEKKDMFVGKKDMFVGKKEMFVGQSGKFAGEVGMTGTGIEMFAERRISREMVVVVVRMLVVTVERGAECCSRHCSCRSSSS